MLLNEKSVHIAEEAARMTPMTSRLAPTAMVWEQLRKSSKLELGITKFIEASAKNVTVLEKYTNRNVKFVEEKN